MEALCCPLCFSSSSSSSILPVKGPNKRAYFLCETCLLIFVQQSDFLQPAQEKARYEEHKNGIASAGYVQFLRRILDPMLPYLTPAMRGLDYGAGPAPTLSLLLDQEGIDCEDYDPFFRPTPPSPPYDFIFATECFEHFFRPSAELERLHGLLRPQGLLGVMTEQWTSLSAFSRWYYTHDRTHVIFFHPSTWDLVCARYGFSIVWRDERRALILRREG